jgi:plastocyanin
MRLSDRAVVLLGILAVLAVGLAAVPASAVDYTVNMTNTGGGAFSPKDLVVNAGDRVRWRNTVTTQHTSTSGTNCGDDGIWDSGFLNSGAFSAYVTFNVGGLYPYFCVVHCESGMTGTIRVNPPVAVATTTWGAIKALYATTE